MVERAEADEATKVALGLAGDARRLFILRAGDPPHGNFFVWRRGSILGIPGIRKHRLWFAVAPLAGAVLVDNDPDDGVTAVGYCFLECLSGQERTAHLPHAPGAPARPPAERLFRVKVVPVQQVAPAK